jgi:hypothetical protein
MANLVVSVMSRCEPFLSSRRGAGENMERPATPEVRIYLSGLVRLTMYALRSQDKLQPSSPKDARPGFRRRQPSVVQILRVLGANPGKLA